MKNSGLKARTESTAQICSCGSVPASIQASAAKAAVLQPTAGRRAAHSLTPKICIDSA